MKRLWNVAALGFALFAAACANDSVTAPSAAPEALSFAPQVRAATSDIQLLGPVTYTRTTGNPAVDSARFAATAGFPLRVSITSDAKQGVNATVMINGVVATQVTAGSVVPVVVSMPSAASNVLEVRMTGKPGSSVTIAISQSVRVDSPWLQRPSPTGNRINKIWALSPSEIYLTADWGVIFRSTDAGATWNQLPAPFGTPVYDVWGTSGTNLYVTSWYGQIAHWNGSAWEAMNQGHFSTNDAIYRLWGSGANDIYAVGDDAFIFHFDGTSWSQVSVGPYHPRAFQGIWGSGQSDVFVVGGTGTEAGYDPATVYHFDGTSWTAMPLPASTSGFYLGGVWGSGPHDVYVSGFNAAATAGIVLHYDGTSWAQVLAIPYWVGAISGTGPNDVYVGGGVGGNLLHFDGHAWGSAPLPSTSDVTTLTILSDNTGWAGGYGMLLHRDP